MSLYRSVATALTPLFLLIVLSTTLTAQGDVSVTPDGSSTSATANSSGNTVQFTVTNTGGWQYEQFFSFSCSKSGSVSSCSVSPSSAYLMSTENTTVTVTYSTGSAGSGTVTLSAWGLDYGGYDSGYYNVTVTGGGGGTPPPTNWDVTPYNYDDQEMSRCAVGCFAATTSFSTVPYYSLDTPRNVTLVYNGDRVDPQPFIHLNVQKPSGVSANQVWMRVKRGGAYQTFTNNSINAKFTAVSSGYQRIGAQLRDTKTLSTGMYDIEIILLWRNGSTTTQTQSWKTKLMIVNENNSPVARGWTIAGVQRLYEQGDSVLITEGDGSAVYFAKDGSDFETPDGDFSKLTTYGTGWRRLYPDSSDVRFNSSGLMTDVYDKFNNRTRFTYISGKLRYIYDPLGDYLYLYYNSTGLYYVRSNNYVGGDHRYTYFYPNSSDRTLERIKDPDGVSTYYTYDTNDRLLTVKDRNGNITTLAYTSYGGKLESATAPSIAVYPTGSASPETEFEPWQLRGVAFSTSVQAVVRPDTVYGRVEEPGGAVTRFTVSHFGQPVATTNALSQTTTFTYDDDGLPVKTVYPNGGTDSTKYNSNGLPTYAQAVDGANTTISYHSKWVTMPTTVTSTNRPTMTYSINYSTGTVTYAQVGTSSSRRSYFYYDTRGRQYKAVSPEGRLLGYSWFSGTNGNTSKDSLPGGLVTEYGYDNFGRQKWTQLTGEPKDSVQYDVMNRVTKSFGGGITSPAEFAYDSLYLRKVTDPEGFELEYSYNALGWLIERTDPANESDTYAYSKDGELNRWINRRGDSTLYVYDDLHRNTQRKYLMGTTWVTDTLTYYTSTSTEWVRASNNYARETVYLNDDGRPDWVQTYVNSDYYTRYYEYLQGGLLDSVRTGTSSLSTFYNRRYTYNTSVGTPSSILLNGYSTTFEYDLDNNMTSVTYPGNDEVEHDLTVLSQRGSIEGYNDEIWRGMGYNTLGRIEHHMWLDILDYLNSHQYTYDGLGQVVGDTALVWVGSQAGCEVAYEHGFECVGGYWNEVQHPPKKKYEYDDVGNRTSQGGDYDTAVTNRIEEFDGCSYDMDDDGNVERRYNCSGSTPDVTFDWTSDNRLYRYKVTSGDTVTVDLRYDARGRLVRKYTHGTLTTVYVWDGDNLFAELNGSSTKILEYSYYGVDNLHAVIDGSGQPHFAHKDGAGNVIAMTDRYRNVEEQYSYDDIWGGVSLDSYASCTAEECNRSKYKGALHIGEEAGIYYMRNRWYEPHTGRFLSEDPIGLEGGINLYVYAGNDPVNHVDPMGLRLCRNGENDDCVSLVELLRSIGGGGGFFSSLADRVEAGNIRVSYVDRFDRELMGGLGRTLPRRGLLWRTPKTILLRNDMSDASLAATAAHEWEAHVEGIMTDNDGKRHRTPNILEHVSQNRAFSDWNQRIYRFLPASIRPTAKLFAAFAYVTVVPNGG